MFSLDLTSLSADQALDLADEVDAAADRAEATRLQVALRWADLHAALDDDGRCLPGAERLIPLGGDGTPPVAEFAPAELGARWRMSHGAATALIGDALDLRHRLPRLWALVLAGAVRPWAARKIAQATRDASMDAAAHADRRVALWAPSRTLGQLEQIAHAALIEADPQAAEEQAREAELRQGVWVGQSTDHGIRDVHIRTDAASAAWFDASVDRVADGLGTLGDTSPKDVRRAKAVGVLARPQQALDLYDAVAEQATGQPAPDRPSRGADPRPQAVLYVHLDRDTLTGNPGAADLEGTGPVTPEQARAWLGHCHVTVKPVLDLAAQAPVDGHDVPDRMRDAVLLRSPVDVFPFATSKSRRRDLDHTIPYVPLDQGGQRGQTRTDNLGPMSRRSHRVKTHSDWKVWQVHDGAFLWRSPHGRCYLVDPHGTHPVTRTRSRAPAQHPTLN
jgi:Domain of unknown function (DUF222)